MTREEREALVRRAWFGEGTAADAVTKIVDAWENDVDEAFQRGIYAEQER
jgi:hypothetical protein